MSVGDTIAGLLRQVGWAFEPLARASTNPRALEAYFLPMGWSVPGNHPAMQALEGPLVRLIDRLDAVGGGAGDVPELLALINGAIQAIDAIGAGGGAGLPAGFASTVARDVLDRLVIEYCEANQPILASCLRLFGVFERQRLPAAPPRLAYDARRVRWEALPDLVNDPLAPFKAAYGWDAAFDAPQFIYNAGYLFTAFGLYVPRGGFSPAAASALLGPTPDGLPGIDVQLVGDEGLSEENLELDVGIRVGATQTGGVLIAPYATAGASAEIPITETLALILEGAGSFESAFGVLLQPGVGVSFRMPPSAPATEIAASLALKAKAADGSRTILFGSAEGSRLEKQALSVKAGGQFSSSRAPVAFVQTAIEGGRIVISMAGADGFLSQIAPGDGFAVDVDLTVGVNSATGLYFAGSGGLEIALPAHIDLGPLQIQSALLAVRLRNSVIALEAGASFKVDLSALVATVDNMGLRADVSFRADGKGNAGPVDLTFAFKPPSGVGLAVRAGPVVGGGFLSFDFDREEYAGGLELDLGGIVSITALGLITTRMPDGSKGFSLLAILSAEFGTGLQLGFGFTLIGVGGLLGLNRTMLLEPLAAGLRSGALNSILFPRDIVPNAPRIIADLRAIFPPAPDRFLIGPMVKLGWGTPTLVSVTLGIIIEIPGNVAILGKLRVALPTNEAALLVLQVAFIGAIEFDKKRLWFYATLYESRLLFAPLDGDVGLLVDYGESSNFLVSVGGFHPRFDPPPLPFPPLNRLTFSLLNQPTARIRFTSYQAVTSNTVQFGAAAELYFGLGPVNVDGHLSIDALIRFSPFYFIVEISASVSVKVFGAGLFSIRLAFSLEGPTPYRAHGRGSISLLFFEVSADFDVTWGDAQDTTLPPIKALPLLADEFAKDANWKALPAPGSAIVVSLRGLGTEDALVVHPLGALRVAQQAAPLALPLDKIGAQKPSDANLFTLDAAVGGGLVKRGDAKAKFAIAQFKDMDDAAKLSAPAFEPLNAGHDFEATAAIACGGATQRTVRFEVVTIDVTFKRVVLRFVAALNSMFMQSLKGAAVSKNAMSLAQETMRQPFDDRFVSTQPGYAIASVRDGRSMAGTTMFASRAEAEAALAGLRVAKPSMAAKAQIVAATELAA